MKILKQTLGLLCHTETLGRNLVVHPTTHLILRTRKEGLVSYIKCKAAICLINVS